MIPLLVIDDDKALLELYHQVLERAGFCVDTAASGEEGTRLFDARDYGLVITDLIMGGMDGNAVARHIRSFKRGGVVPVVCISGTPWKADTHLFDAVMHKPVPMKDLVKSVRFLMGPVPGSEEEITPRISQVFP